MPHTVLTVPPGTPPPEQLRLLGRRLVHPPGAALLTAGQRPTCVLLLEQGLVKVVMPSKDGRLTFLAVRTAGTVLGSSAAITRTAHPATVITVDRCVTYRVDILRVNQLVERDWKTWLVWRIEEDARRIVEADERTAAWHCQSAGTRLALQLLAWAEEIGAAALDGGVEIIGLTRQDLADAIGVRPNTVDEVLARLCHACLLTTGRKRFHIPDPTELARAAHLGGL
jgi:CRP/FNR family cyclic AMP-dependent transcriptional regulator